MENKQFKVGDRRPIPAREFQLSSQVAGLLAKSGATPNAISVWGMIAGVSAGALIAATSHWPEYRPLLFLSGASLIFVRLLANMFDGMVAVILAKPNPLGEVFNEVPDRVSDSSVLIGCGYALNSSAIAGFWAAVFAMMTAYIRAVGKGCGARQSFLGPLAKQQRMFLCIASLVICAVFPPALDFMQQNIAGTQFSQSIMVPVLWFIAAGSAYTCLRRLSAISRDLINGGK